MTINKQALRADALEATGGSWVRESGEGWEAICCDDDQGNAGFIIAEFQGENATANRKFVQSANPTTVLELLDALEAAEKRVTEMEARMALAALKAEPYGYVHKAVYEDVGCCGLSNDHEAHHDSQTHIAVYTAPPAPAVPDAIQKLKDGQRFKYVKGGIRYSVSYANGWNACRVAMIQAGNSPVTPDGYALVPKEITCAMDDAAWEAYHETRCMSDIWAALLAAAPQQEVK